MEVKRLTRIYVGVRLKRNVGQNERITFSVQIFSNITRTVKTSEKAHSARRHRVLPLCEKPTDVIALQSISSHARNSDNYIVIRSRDNVGPAQL